MKETKSSPTKLAYMRRRYAEKAEELKAYSRAHYHAHKADHFEYQKKWKARQTIDSKFRQTSRAYSIKWRHDHRDVFKLKNVAIVKQRQELTLSYALKHYHEWTLSDLSYLISNRRTSTYKQMAIYLGRSYYAVKAILKKLDGGIIQKRIAEIVTESVIP